MKKTLLFLIIFIFTHDLSARETMNQKYQKIADIGRQILISKNYETRSFLVQNIRNQYQFLPPVWGLIPTYDITNSYKPYIQKYKLSCEIAAVKMVMESLGTIVSEEDILFRIPVFSGAYATGGVWGDPEIAFVGDIQGSQYNKTGYGIYERPLAQYLTNRGYTTHFMNATTYQPGMSAHRHMITLLKALHHGSKIIVWGDYCTNTKDEDGILEDTYYKTLIRLFPIAAKNACERSAEERIFTWKTVTGKHITALSGEHTFLLLGYIGNIEHPTHIIVWDTATGRHIFSYNEWMRKWSLLQFRSLIVSGDSSL